MDAAAELLKQIVPVPEAVELQRLTNRDKAIYGPAVQPPDKSVQFLRRETKPRQGLIPAVKEASEIQKTFQVRLEEQSAARMSPLETGQRVQRQDGQPLVTPAFLNGGVDNGGTSVHQLLHGGGG